MLTILLSVGSDEGSYEFEVRDEDGSPQIRGSAVAVIRNYITTIETTVDLRALNPNSFQFAIRRAGQTSWRTYPLKVR